MSGVEKVKLPAVNVAHLTRAMVNKNGRVDGFHILPASVIMPVSVQAIIIPSCAVSILDAAGRLFAGAELQVTPLRLPFDRFDAFEARVEISDAHGIVRGTNSAKSFFPQDWTLAQIQTGIYSAYANHFLSGGAPFFTRMALLTPEGVMIEMRVSGHQTSLGITLKEISTAYLVPGQLLDSTHIPA